ncbi:DNA-processing protein DprA [Pseudomonas matsuisoli]|uniref:DNA protecting protein DprA n=1 Tax=Pseudomonas matsuisoli TaxID=1515666 RepID=A0A917PVU4_9PSED|nr:DNA-processing protein DprA [Pseudomonas matsuisoli]GGJ95004.1 DNA protecting protein DprA [Pseudomonas matsuisoli]
MSKYSPAELEARLRLHLLPEVGPRRFRRLISVFETASSALSAPASAWRSLGIPTVCAEARRDSAIRDRAAASLHWLEQRGQSVVMWDEDGYPALLAELNDAPPLLFVWGNPAILEMPQLAMVGSRRASQPGLDTAFAFARSLAAGGFCVTSGLALGIDGAAHRGALDAQGATIAVLGTGLQCLYPKRHVTLAQDIADQGGAVVSELPLDTAPQAANFPRRNRIISGLSVGTLVVEASPSSGSLITARLASEQGREVYAIPGSIHHPGARGCHQLIREGATLVESVDDILGQLRGWHAVPVSPVTDTDSEHYLVRLLTAAPLSSEAIVRASDKPLSEVLVALTELELDGRVACENGLWVSRPR